MGNKILHTTEFSSKQSVYRKIIETDLTSHKEKLIWRKVSGQASVDLELVRYLSPENWHHLLSQLNSIIEYNRTIPDPEEWLSIEGGLITVFEIFPHDFLNANGHYQPGGTFFYRSRLDNKKFSYSYSGTIVRVGNPKDQSSYRELNLQGFKATNTVNLGKLKLPRHAPAASFPELAAN